MVPEVQKPSQEPCIAFYPKRRIRNLLREKHFHGVSSGSRHEYLLKLRYGKVSSILPCCSSSWRMRNADCLPHNAIASGGRLMIGSISDMVHCQHWSSSMSNIWGKR